MENKKIASKLDLYDYVKYQDTIVQIQFIHTNKKQTSYTLICDDIFTFESYQLSVSPSDEFLIINDIDKAEYKTWIIEDDQESKTCIVTIEDNGSERKLALPLLCNADEDENEMPLVEVTKKLKAIFERDGECLVTVISANGKSGIIDAKQMDYKAI